jgi:hypothetical protein
MIYVFDKDENNSITGLKEQFRNLPKFMSIVWKLKNPKIIIPIITGVTNFKNWKNRKLEDQFKRGIIKVILNLTRFNPIKLIAFRLQVKLNVGS